MEFVFCERLKMLNETPSPEVQNFFMVKVVPVLDRLRRSVYNLLDIQQRFTFNCARIKSRYNVEVGFSPQASVIPRAGLRYVSMACGLSDGKPVIAMYVPTLMRCHDELVRFFPLNFPKIFELMLVVDLIHETDHFVIGEIGGSDIESTVRIEQAVWSETCLHTIKPLIEVHRVQVHHGHKRYFDAWQKGGEEWTQFILEQYKDKHDRRT